MKALILLLALGISTAQAQCKNDVCFEERIVMDPQPITYSPDELIAFLGALKFEWKIKQLGSGATVGVCPRAKPDACVWIPPKLKDKFIDMFIQL